MNNAVLITQVWPGRHNEEMLNVVREWHQAYCDLHGFDYWVIQRSMTSWPMNEKTWERLVLIRKALDEGYDSVIWMDADAIIKKKEVDLREACQGVGACYDEKFPVHHYNCGVMYFENTPKVMEFVTEWRSRYPGGLWEGQHWHEQTEFNKMIPSYPGLIHRLENKWNSYPTTPCPENEIIVKAWHGAILPQQKINEMRLVRRGLA